MEILVYFVSDSTSGDCKTGQESLNEMNGKSDTIIVMIMLKIRVWNISPIR